ncbi:MAG: alpha/beta fold hydrolase [Candidatus Helarchaeota archaeon]|nr:alpha/beta fold hydrolase [Candidatus Helarchaeota archaeon]
MNSKALQYSLLIIFIGLILIGILVLNFFPSQILRTTHQTDSDEMISFNLYRPKELAQPTPVVIMGHGVIVNKEMMTTFAIELAYNGFIVANIDWSGHGQSQGPLANLTRDLEVIIAKVSDLLGSLANMSAIALLGYSMGGGPTYQYAVNNSNVKAWVGVGTWADGDISNTTNPRNVLLIVGALDEAISPDQLKNPMVNLTGLSINEIEFETQYGYIHNGTARKIHVVPWADHLITPWHRDFVIPATEWITTSFGGAIAPFSQDSVAFDIRNAFAWIGFFSLIGLTFTSATILAKKFQLKKENETPRDEPIDPKVFETHSLLSFIGKYYLFTFLLLPTIFLFIPLFLFTPLAFTAAMIAIVGCFTVNLLIYSWRLAKKWNISLKSILKKNISQKKEVWYYSIILTLLFWVCYYLTIGRNYLGMIPSLTKLPYLFLYSAILFVIIFISSVFLQKFAIPFLESKLHIKNPIINYLAISFINFLLVYSWFLGLILGFCIIIGNYFIAMILILMLPIFLLLVFFGVYMERKTGSVIPGTLLHAIVLGFVTVSLSPYGSMFNFLGIFL